MANRVLLDINGLRISQPGVNVLTSNNSQILFHQDGSHLVPILSGEFNMGTADVTTSAKLLVSYGKTFSRMPIVLLYYVYRLNDYDICYGINYVEMSWQLDVSHYFYMIIWGDRDGIWYASENNVNDDDILRYQVFDYDM